MPNLTRRSIMGGAAALPFIATPALSAQIASKPDRTAWDRARDSYERTLSDLDRAYAAGLSPDDMLPAEDAYLDAYMAMIRTPSPHAEALAYKLDAAWGRDFREDPVEQIKSIIFADALRLAGKGGA